MIGSFANIHRKHVAYSVGHAYSCTNMFDVSTHEPRRAWCCFAVVGYGCIGTQARENAAIVIAISLHAIRAHANTKGSSNVHSQKECLGNLIFLNAG